jgi:hypothetical protein
MFESLAFAATLIPRRLFILGSRYVLGGEAAEQLLLLRLAAVVAFQHDRYHHVFKPVFPSGSLDHCVFQSN